MFGIITAMTEIPCMLSGQVYRVTEKLGNKKTISLIIGAAFISSAILIFAKGKLISIILIAIVKFSFSMISPIIMEIENNSIQANSNNRATILSIYSMFSSVIEVGFSILVTIFITGSVQIGFVITTIFIMVTLVIFIILKDKIIE